jgi:hypothetical protein
MARSKFKQMGGLFGGKRFAIPPYANRNVGWISGA